jgi:signal transduction histidine kinase
MRGQPALTVIDDGAGFDSGHLSQKGMGLRIMRHRAQVIGAQFAIDPGEAGGMVLSVLPQAAAPAVVHAGA